MKEKQYRRDEDCRLQKTLSQIVTNTRSNRISAVNPKSSQSPQHERLAPNSVIQNKSIFFKQPYKSGDKV